MSVDHIPDPKENRRFVIAFVLSMLVILAYFVFYQQPRMQAARAQKAAVAAQQAKDIEAAAQNPVLDETSAMDALKSRAAIPVATKRLTGSIALTGLRFDDLLLNKYSVTLNSPDHVRLLTPSGSPNAYFAEIGVMAPQGATYKVPDSTTVWRITGPNKTLTETTPVTVEWNNGAGLLFRRTITVDAHYLFTVEQTIENKTEQSVTLFPYALISQSHHTPKRGEEVAFEDRTSNVLHTGAVSYLNGELEDPSYDDIKDDKELRYPQVKGWLGMTGKYWLVSLLPQNDATFDARFAYRAGDVKDHDIYQADLRGTAVTIAPGASGSMTDRLFTGAKSLNLLNMYETDLSIRHFDLAIDFGTLYLLTKPLYRLLHALGEFFAEHNDTMSFALALLTLTVLVRLLTYPLASKSYRSMAKMKQVGPQMQLLKEKHGDDKDTFQREVIALYKREKVNPASGCIPMLIQIPIFFALYKVLYVSLDMRHQPFWGWINDMSAPDPTSIFNLFGLIPWTPPGILMIGAWPLLYGITLWLQQKMNPAPDDPVQKQVMAIFPWMFMFMFAHFPAGLVIYYVWSNLLGIVQQYVIKRQLEKPELVVMEVKDAKPPRGKKAKNMPTIVVEDDDNAKS